MSYNSILASAPLTTQNYHLKMIGTTIGNSLIWDNGTNVGIGNTNTTYNLDVTGTGRFTGALTGTSATFSGQGQFNAASNGIYLLLNAPTNGGTITMQAGGVSFADIGSELGNFGTGSATNLCVSARSGKDLILGGGALKTLTLASAGAATFSSSVQITGYSAPTSGAGLELFYTGGEARLFGYDRTNSVYKPMGIGVGGIQLYLAINGNVQVGNDSNPYIEIANGGSTDVKSGIKWMVGSGRTYYGAIELAASSASNSYLSFSTMNSGTVAERLRIASTGAATFSVGNDPTINLKNTNASSIMRGTINWYGADSSNVGAKIFVDGESTGINSNMYFYTKNASTLTQRMTISNAGNVSVNSGSSAAPELGVRGTTGSNSVGGSARLAIYDDATANVRSWIFQIDGSSQLRTFYYNGTSWATNGYQTTGGTWTNSDERRKTNIENLEYGLNEILQLTPKKFNFKHDIEGGNIRQKDMGFIAQEVLPIMPLAVDAYIDGEEEYYSMSYANIVPVLVKAIQEMNTKFEEQQATITSLQDRLTKAGL